MGQLDSSWPQRSEPACAAASNRATYFWRRASSVTSCEPASRATDPVDQFPHDIDEAPVAVVSDTMSSMTTPKVVSRSASPKESSMT